VAEADWFNAEDMLDNIRAESARRRAAPLDFFAQFLSDIWKGSTPEEAGYLWRVKVEHYPWYADDALYCLNAVLADPPDNLLDIMREHGWLALEHEMDAQGVERPYSFGEVVDWLRNMRDEYRAVYEAFPATVNQRRNEEE
jgi:hypothetical protein